MLTLSELIIAIEIGLIYGILALGIYLTFRIINFPDLTCDGSFVTGAAVSSVMIKAGINPIVALLLAAVSGGLAGFFTGILYLRMKIEDLLSGIIVAFILYSVNLRIMGANPNISLVNEATIFNYLDYFLAGYANNYDISILKENSLLITLVIVGLLIFLLARLLNSNFGLGLRTVGQNKLFAAANGVNVAAMIMFGLVLSNALVGFCGALFTQYQEFCDVSQGVGCLVIGLASVIIGEKFLPKIWVAKILSNIRVDRRIFLQIFLLIFFCVVGSVAYRVFIAFAINSDIWGLKTQDINLITGLIIVIAMGKFKNKKLR